VGGAFFAGAGGGGGAWPQTEEISSSPAHKCRNAMTIIL
jgi:hypothetical protein